MNLRKIFKKILSTAEEREFSSIIDATLKEMKKRDINYWSLKANDMKSAQAITALSNKSKANFILYLIEEIHAYHDGRISYNTISPEYIKDHIYHVYLNYALKTKLELKEDDVDNLAKAFLSSQCGQGADITTWPLGLFITHVERSFKDNVPPLVRENMDTLKTEMVRADRTEKDVLKNIERINAFLFRSENATEVIKPTHFLGNDNFAKHANEIIELQPAGEKVIWYKLVANAQKANGSKPSSRYIEQNRDLIKDLGTDKFKKVVIDWFEFVVKLKETETQHTYPYGNTPYTYSTYEFLEPPNTDTLKGFVWMCSQFHDTKTLQTIAALAERSFKKIPGKGPAAAAVGNASLYTLFKSKGLEGISHLSRLKLRIKQSSTQALIEKYLEEAARAEGISVTEIEDLAVDDYGLVNGKREFEIDGYKAVVEIQGIGSVAINWFKPDNTPQKSVPATIKDHHAQRLKKIKDVAKQVEVALTAQRDRIDRMLRSERKMTWAYFQKFYFEHGLMSYLTHDILWKLETNGKSHTCIFIKGQWTTLTKDIVSPDESYLVSLWHPSIASVGEVRSWRKFLMAEKILQPIKQVFREVYFLTDAEVNTRTYSNRMAAHILKQHQFNSLAKIRGWRYSLLGAYDDGRYNEGAELAFPEKNLRAEFWVNEVNADDAFNDVGIWNFISTDQIRFVNLITNEPVEVSTVPPIIFSEVMRDVDLFVGVASVGNDPTWQDNGGMPAYRDYWQSYSFGELTEIAKTRKEVLENLVPRLKIAPVASIKDRFLVVKGKKRTYKIHIGSTNILMEPNDQYLCIVPDRSKKDNTGNLFLPFEGDTGLSVILSKAMLLADDDKISDPTILSQINRK